MPAPAVGPGRAAAGVSQHGACHRPQERHEAETVSIVPGLVRNCRASRSLRDLLRRRGVLSRVPRCRSPWTEDVAVADVVGAVVSRRRRGRRSGRRMVVSRVWRGGGAVVAAPVVVSPWLSSSASLVVVDRPKWSLTGASSGHHPTSSTIDRRRGYSARSGRGCAATRTVTAGGERRSAPRPTRGPRGRSGCGSCVGGRRSCRSVGDGRGKRASRRTGGSSVVVAARLTGARVARRCWSRAPMRKAHGEPHDGDAHAPSPGRRPHLRRALDPGPRPSVTLVHRLDPSARGDEN